MTCSVVTTTIVLALATIAAGQLPSDAPRAVVLVTTYADGRAVPHVVTARGSRSWTPMFPRIASWTPPDGTLPVAAINYVNVLVNGSVNVAVSVLRGELHQKEDAVATVSVGPGERRVIQALRDFGVEPVTLSLMPLAPGMLYPPKVANRTAGLEVWDIEVVTEPAPVYRVTVKNLSAKAAMNIHVQTYLDGQLALSGAKGNPDGRPIIAPGDTYSFLWSASRLSGPSVDG